VTIRDLQGKSEHACIVGCAPTQFDFTTWDENTLVCFLNGACAYDEHAPRSVFVSYHLHMWADYMAEPHNAVPLIGDYRTHPLNLKTIVGPYIRYNPACSKVLRHTPAKLLASNKLYRGSGSITTAIHLMYVLGYRKIQMVGCSGSPTQYDPRARVTHPQPSGSISRIRSHQIKLAKKLGVQLVYP